jgi:hypothetical protein
MSLYNRTKSRAEIISISALQFVWKLIETIKIVIFDRCIILSIDKVAKDANKSLFQSITAPKRPGKSPKWPEKSPKWPEKSPKRPEKSLKWPEKSL